MPIFSVTVIRKIVRPVTHYKHFIEFLSLHIDNMLLFLFNEEKTKVICESFGTGITQVVSNVKRPCSVCLKGVSVNSIRCTQCIQWVHARCSRVKGSLKNVESSFICRRCKGELCETRQVKVR